MAEDLSELKKLVGSKKLVYGTEQTMKGLKQGKIEKIYVSSNAPKNVREDIEHYGKISKVVKIVWLDTSNDELGIFVKKPFAVSVLGVMKA